MKNYYVVHNDGTTLYVEDGSHTLSPLCTKITKGNVTHVLFNNQIKSIKITTMERTNEDVWADSF